MHSEIFYFLPTISSLIMWPDLSPHHINKNQGKSVVDKLEKRLSFELDVLLPELFDHTSF